MSVSLWITALATLGAALLSGMGLGSAGIFVLYLTAVAGLPQVEAQAVNLVFFLLSAGASLGVHLRQRRIPVRAVMYLVAWAVPGTVLGTYLAGALDADLVRRLFGGMLVVTGLPALVGTRGHAKRE